MDAVLVGSGQGSSPGLRRRKVHAGCEVACGLVRVSASPGGARLVATTSLGLRAGDALHLVVARELRASHFATFDARQGAAAQSLGLDAVFGPA